MTDSVGARYPGASVVSVCAAGEEARKKSDGGGGAARRAREGEESGNEECISPRRGRRGVDPPDLR